ncbi:hypothetical protein MATL_G00156340 [Megalops atlanticus]|uniref:Structural maintenance of chromosomes protein 6 n=1 Tax=Megalops atlanticus TaxID=7932 RepID=A0A9D3T8N5_MEGAT|nr:hypothetical protein MATL_G00156340 [Megalops atlanticus]
MMKRKSKTPTGVKASKIIRTEESRGSLEEDEEEDLGQSFRDSHAQTTSSAGDIGVIESISLKNFMCHHLLGPFQFGPNVNFIVGNNGSGKSAILTALIVGLGGKATVTNRGASLKGFVRNGESSADVIIRLRNRGSDAYKGEVYGDCISIEQHITSDGSRTCKLKSITGHLVSNKREELTSILDHFNIQVDNPVSILNQEMSKQFLQSKNETDKYKFFMKATLLEQMKRDYIHIKQTKAATSDQVEKQEEALKSLRQEYLQKKEKYESLSSLEEMKKTLEDLQHKMAWCLVSEKEYQVQQLNEQIEQEEGKDNYEEKLSRCQCRVTQAEQRYQEVQRRLEKAKEQEKSLRQESCRLTAELKKKSDIKKDQEVAVCCAEKKLEQLEKDRSLLQERIQKLRNSGHKNYESELLKRQRKISAMKEDLEKHKAEGRALNQQIQDQQKALFSLREESDKLRLEEKNIQVVIEAKQKRRNQLMASRSNRIKRFGDRMPDLLESIDKTHGQGRFLKKPVGPIGACVTLKDPSLAVAVESCLRSFMKTFCCDNYRDEKVLQGLMSQYFPVGGRPQIIVCPFSDRVYDVRGRGVCHPEFPSVLDCLVIPSPVVANCLIDMRGIETVLVIKDNEKARHVMQRGRPPKNCREAFTGEGDQVYTNRYYSAESSRSLYLGGDLEADIRLVESELENATAQLARFQLHSSSVMRAIQQKENDLQGVVLRLKKNQAAVNQLKTRIVDLENTEDTQKDDISTLEEEAREVEEKMESEERSVREAREELEESARQAEDLKRRCHDVLEQLEQLAGEEGLVKKEQEELVKAETESNRLTDELRCLERLQQEHQENIQAMRNELAFKEEEAQEYVAKAQRICPERQQVNRSAKSIDMEITRLRHRISAQESSQGTQEQITREYKEALENYRSKTSQVRDLRKFVSRLDYIINDRQARYKILRRSLSVRCKLYFNNFLTELNCCGSMMFDHNNETLSISVKPPGSEDDDVNDVRSLSGGERSFSTVCFILSLWEITESPFRCLDEFDVYMDMRNRRVSMDLLLSLSERQHQRQFLFITPQSTSTLPKSDRVRILTLADPERGLSQDQDNEEEE